VGQTQHTAFKRFQEHVRCAGRVARLGKHARVQDSSDFHVSMARIGWEDFMVIPLVHVPRGDRSMEDWVTALRVVEDEWIARFQSWAPRGFNSRWNALRAQPFGAVRRRANGNLMLRNRRRDPNSVNAEYGSMGQAARGRKYAFRNWNRRCLCWAEMCQRGRDPTPIIRGCSARVLARCYYYLRALYPRLPASERAERGSLSGARVRSVAAMLLRELRRRKTVTVPSGRRQHTNVLVLPFVRRAHSRLRGLLTRVLGDRSVMSMVPAEYVEEFRDLIPVFRYPPTLGARLFNYKQWASQSSVSDIQEAPCLCNDPRFRPFVDESLGHVCTGDMRVVRNGELQRMMELGVGFRLEPPCDSDEDLAQHFRVLLRDALKKYCAGIASDPVRWLLYLDAVMSTFDSMVASTHFGDRPSVVCVDGSPKAIPVGTWDDVAPAVRFLRNHFVVTSADKASNNFMVVCARHYLESLQKELNSSDAYAPVKTAEAALVAAQADWIETEHHVAVRPKYRVLPVLAYTVKNHKLPVGRRFIAFSGQTVLTELSRRVGWALKAVMRRLGDVAESEARDLGHSWWFLVENSMEVSGLVRALGGWEPAQRPTLAASVRAFDIAQMYTAIPHDDLVEKVTELVHLAFGYRRGVRSLVIDSAAQAAEWANTDAPRDAHGNLAVAFTEHSLIEAIEYVVRNAYVTCLDQVYRQTRGIPMGTNSSPFLANMYLMAYERRFIRELIALGKGHVARSFASTTRFLDDALFLANPVVDDYLVFDPAVPGDVGLYPSTILHLEETTVGDGHAHYMDLDISYDVTSGRYSLDLWDKRKDLNIAIIRFPDAGSMIAEFARYSIVTSQCYRFFRIMWTTDRFVHHVAELCRVLIFQKGYQRGKVLKRARQFIWRAREVLTVPWAALYTRLHRLVFSSGL